MLSCPTRPKNSRNTGNKCCADSTDPSTKPRIPETTPAPQVTAEEQGRCHVCGETEAAGVAGPRAWGEAQRNPQGAAQTREQTHDKVQSIRKEVTKVIGETNKTENKRETRESQCEVSAKFHGTD